MKMPRSGKGPDRGRISARRGGLPGRGGGCPLGTTRRLPVRRGHLAGWYTLNSPDHLLSNRVTPLLSEPISTSSRALSPVALRLHDTTPLWSPLKTRKQDRKWVPPPKFLRSTPGARLMDFLRLMQYSSPVSRRSRFFTGAAGWFRTLYEDRHSLSRPDALLDSAA